MIFRRVKAHIEKENWFAVSVDFFIVVLGMFMGFQLQQWNENRSDAANSREYLKRLVVDMELSTARNEFQAKLAFDHVESYDLVLNALQNCHLEKSKQAQFGASLYNLGKFDMPTMLMGTIDELNATGNFLLIRNLELRSQISESVRVQKTILTVESQITALVIPSINYVRTFVRFNLDKHLNNPPKIDPSYVIYDFDEVCTDRKFINAIGTVREMTLAASTFNQHSSKNQAALVASLKEELGIENISEGK